MMQGVTLTSLYNTYRQLRKQVNDRLYKLERAKLTTESSAYRYAQREAFDSGYIKFNESGKPRVEYINSPKKTNVKSLSTIVDELRTFLASKSSTPSRIIATRNKAYDTFVKHYPNVNVSADDFGEFWADTYVQQFKALYGSQEVAYLLEDVGTQTAKATAEAVFDRIQHTGVTVSIDDIRQMSQSPTKEVSIENW